MYLKKITKTKSLALCLLLLLYPWKQRVDILDTLSFLAFVGVWIERAIFASDNGGAFVRERLEQRLEFF